MRKGRYSSLLILQNSISKRLFLFSQQIHGKEQGRCR
nr:MAG TPA: hypothetical protein [Caudoviricetes sp.]